MSAIPSPDSPFGAKVQIRFEHEMVVWLTTVDDRGVPQPNPVWFVSEGETVLVYNQEGSVRLRNLAARPRVSLNFNNGDGSGDTVVLTGTARVVDDVPPADANEPFMRKYRHQMTKVGFDPEVYARKFPVPVRIFVDRVRGM